MLRFSLATVRYIPGPALVTSQRCFGTGPKGPSRPHSPASSGASTLGTNNNNVAAPSTAAAASPNEKKKFKALGAGFATNLKKNITTAQCAAKSSATVAKHGWQQVAKDLTEPKERRSPSLGSTVAASVANCAASTIPERMVTPTSAKMVPSVLNKKRVDEVNDTININKNNNNKNATEAGAGSSGTVQTGTTMSGSNYHEHCLMGWSPEQIYKVVADVASYSSFLPWCVSSQVDASIDKIVPVDHQTLVTGEGHKAALLHQEMKNVTDLTATLGVGFSFLRESYTSQVHMEPSKLIQATLLGKSTLLRELRCTWYFGPIETSEELLHAISGSSVGLIGKNVATREVIPGANGREVRAELIQDDKIHRGSTDGTTQTRSLVIGNLIRDRELKTAKEVIAALKQEASDQTIDHTLHQTRKSYVRHAEFVMESVANVKFDVGFDFRNPLHQSLMSAMVMSNVVTVMTTSFEARCQELHGKPVIARKALPPVVQNRGAANVSNTSAAVSADAAAK